MHFVLCCSCSHSDLVTRMSTVFIQLLAFVVRWCRRVPVMTVVTVVTVCSHCFFSYLWLVGNGGMGYNYNCYYYHSSIPY